MSWILNPDGEKTQVLTPDEDKVEDYSGRKVTKKSANAPFLAYTEYRRKQEEAHSAWLKRKKEREEKKAKGEEVGPEEPDPTAVKEIGLFGLIKFLVYLVIGVALAGKFITGSYTWEYEDVLPTLKSLWPSTDRLYSESGLAKFDGTDPNKPILLAIDYDVYDVTEGKRTYGPGGSYHFMAGRDAARAFATGCFATHRTHDLRGLTEREEQSMAHWKKFFRESKKYPKVGKVVHPLIDPDSPIPEHCDPERSKKSQDAHEKRKEEAASAEASKATQNPKSDTDSKHEEL